METRNLLKKVGIVIMILLLICLLSLRYYKLAVERECSWNPVKLLFNTHELWCECGTPNTYYGGFSCMTCERFCEKYKIGEYYATK